MVNQKQPTSFRSSIIFLLENLSTEDNIERKKEMRETRGKLISAKFISENLNFQMSKCCQDLLEQCNGEPGRGSVLVKVFVTTLFKITETLYSHIHYSKLSKTQNGG